MVTVREYRLGYYPVDTQSEHNYDRLKSVEECGNYSETGHTLHCLPPTWFRWNGGYESELTKLFGTALSFKTMAADRVLAQRTYTPTNTDLKGDRLGFSGFYGQAPVLDEFSYFGSPGSSSPRPWRYGIYDNDDEPKVDGKDYSLLGDVNGDGLTDIVGLKSEVSGFRHEYRVITALSNGQSFEKNTFHRSTSPLFDLPLGSNTSDYPAFLSDVNADGLSDLVLFGYSRVLVSLSDGTQFTTPKEWSHSDTFIGRGGWDKSYPRFVLDMNGDGRADLAGLGNDGIFVALSQENDTDVFGSAQRMSSEFKRDNSHKAGFETNSSNDDIVFSSSVANEIARFVFADVNGDGLPDAIRMSDGGIEVKLNNGRGGFLTSKRWDGSGSQWGNHPDPSHKINQLAYSLSRFTPYNFSDVNGDGLNDFVLFARDGVRVAFSTGKRFKKPVKVSSSFGSTTGKYNITAQNPLADCSGIPHYSHYNSTITQNRPMWVDERKDPRYMVDVNGDGRADILGFGSNGIYVALSKGSTFGAMTKWIAETDTSFSYNACWRPGYNVRTVGDVTGDGLVDLIGLGFSHTHVGQNFVKPWRLEQIISGGYLPNNGSNTYDGLHRSIDIDYDSLTTSNSYQRSSRNQYRQFPLYVVTAHHDSDGEIGSVRPHRSTLKYGYQDLKVDPWRGMQGFRSREVMDDNAKTRTVEFYHQHFPMTGRPYVQRTYAKDARNRDRLVREVATNLDSSGNTANSQGLYELLLKSTVETNFTLKAGKRYKQLLTEYKNYDNCGQAGEIVKSMGNWDGSNAQPHEAVYNVTTLNDYPTSGDCRDKSRLISARVTHAVTGQPAQTKKSDFNYYSDGLLHQEIVEPERSDEQKVTTTYGYNRYGQITSKSISGQGGRINKDNASLRSPNINRTTTTTYTSDHRFVQSTTDPEGFTRYVEYDTRFGLVKKATNANGLVTQTRYNGFGQPYLKEAPQSGVVHTQYEWCNHNIQGATARYCITSKNLNLATSQYSKQYFDSVDRLLREESMGAGLSNNMTRVYQDKAYDRDTGRLLRESLPYYHGRSPTWVSYTYDTLGRTLTVRQPDSSVTTMDYDGLTITTKNAKNQTKTEIRTPRGHVVKAIDAIGGSVNHVYDSLGNLKTTTVTAKEGAGNTGSDRSIVTRFDYDLRGNKTRMTDPDMGTWHYHYNALGEMTLQVDAKGQATVLSYDKLGRMIKREALDESTAWEHYPATAGERDRGRLKAVTSSMRDYFQISSTYSKTFTYNDYGQVTNVMETVPGYGGSRGSGVQAYENYHFQRTYDNWGRLATLRYPSVVNFQSAVGVTYQYDPALGHLEAISDSNSSQKHWELTGLEADGKTRQQKLGDQVTSTYDYDTLRRLDSMLSTSRSGTLQSMDYQFDSLGNLRSREDFRNRAREEFAYDDLNRLIETRTRYSGLSTPIVSRNTYDGHGNLRNKAGLTYRYADESPFGSAYHTSFHQVNQIVRENNSTAEALTYDANGNVTRLPFRRNMKLYWTSFNKLASAFPNGYTAIFRYNADHQRMYQRNGATGDTWYAGDGLVEHFKRRSDGRETLKYALMAGGQSVGYIKISFDRTASPSGGYQATNQERLTFYQLKDHLGSPQVLVDANGNAVENLGFTAWGERRAASWNPNEIPTPALDLLHDYALTQGFTGHEHDDVFGFINMKGRLYDPKLGRFLSADPFVQFPNNTQSYNRYSYVLNNPLSYTDPSGYLLDFIGDLIGGVVDFISDNIRTIAAIAVQAFLTTLGVPPGLISFGLTLVSGGSLESAIQNGIFATVSAGVSSFIGNASAQAGGLAGAIGRGVARFGETFRSIVHGVAQGTLSVLQGGKFGHGFASAFVSHETAGLGEHLGLGTPRDGNTGLAIGRTVLAATIGGTVSQITGGKFANGAQTAAFVHLFNNEGVLNPPKPIDWGNIGKVLSGIGRAFNTLAMAASLSGSTPRTIFYHGTDLASAEGLLAGKPLSIDIATSKHIDGAIGFYLADNYAAAEYFAVRAGGHVGSHQGAVLEYHMTNYAIGQLKASGAVIRPIPFGGANLPGNEFFIPPTSFPLFDSLRSGGNIVVTP